MDEQMPGITEPRRAIRQRAKLAATDPGAQASESAWQGISARMRTVGQTSHTIGEMSGTGDAASRIAGPDAAGYDTGTPRVLTEEHFDAAPPAGATGPHDDVPARPRGRGRGALVAAALFALGVVANLATSAGSGAAAPSDSGAEVDGLLAQWLGGASSMELPESALGVGDLPDFDPVRVTRTGADVVDLPAATGVVTVRYDGEHLSVWALDADGLDVDHIVTVHGLQEATAAWGVFEHFLAWPGEIAQLEITATGPWELALAPLTHAPELPAAGEGHGTFRHNGPATSWTLTRAETEALGFVDVFSDAGWTTGLLNAGDSAVTFEDLDGAAFVLVRTEGPWTIRSRRRHAGTPGPAAKTTEPARSLGTEGGSGVLLVAVVT